MIVSKKLRNETLLMLALLVTACGGGSTPPSAEPETSGVAEPRPDIYAEFVLSTDLSHLSENSSSTETPLLRGSRAPPHAGLYDWRSTTSSTHQIAAKRKVSVGLTTGIDQNAATK